MRNCAKSSLWVPRTHNLQQTSSTLVYVFLPVLSLRYFLTSESIAYNHINETKFFKFKDLIILLRAVLVK